MNIHIGGRLFLVAAVLGAIAVFAMGFFVALEVRSVVAGSDSGPLAAPPNPGHSWSEIGDLPGTMWHSNNDGDGSGLDADTVDGVTGAQAVAGTKGFAFGPMLATKWVSWGCNSTSEIAAVPFVKVTGLDTLALQFASDSQPCACEPELSLAVSQCGALETPTTPPGALWTDHLLTLDVSSIPDGSECVAVLKGTSGAGSGLTCFEIRDRIFEHR